MRVVIDFWWKIWIAILKRLRNTRLREFTLTPQNRLNYFQINIFIFLRFTTYSYSVIGIPINIEYIIFYIGSTIDYILLVFIINDIK